MSKLNKRKLDRYLRSKSKEELIADIHEMTGKFDNVREYYEIRMYSDEIVKTINKYKEIITRVFQDAGGGLPDWVAAKSAVRQFKRIARTPEQVADMMFHYLEESVRFTKKRKRKDEGLAEHLETLYKDAVGYVEKQGLGDLFAVRLKNIVVDLSGFKFGWDFFIPEFISKYFSNK